MRFTNQISNRTRHTFVQRGALLLAVMLSACGGGGSGGSADQIQSQSNTPITQGETDTGAASTNPASGTQSTAIDTGNTAAPDAATSNNNPSGESPVQTLPAAANAAEPEDQQTDIDGSPISETFAAIDESSTQVIQAVDTGDASVTTVDELLHAAVLMGEEDLSRCISSLESVYPDGLTSASIPYLSNYTYSSRRLNYPLHAAAASGATYSWIGEEEDGTRYVFYGASILHIIS